MYKLLFHLKLTNFSLFLLYPENKYIFFLELSIYLHVKFCAKHITVSLSYLLIFYLCSKYYLKFHVQLISYKRYLETMETIYLSLVHTGSWEYFVMKSLVDKLPDKFRKIRWYDEPIGKSWFPDDLILLYSCDFSSLYTI